MARHISIIVILAVAGFVILSFNSFGSRPDRIPQSVPETSKLGEEAVVVPEPPSSDYNKENVIAPKPPVVVESTETVADVKSAVFASESSNILTGGAIAPKLENATIKAELGRASWKLFHTMMARFPDKPTHDDSLALKTYIQLFARLYPCGDCARHFQKLLAQFPPQTSSRNAAAGWACHVHNQVNERLEKPLFDCNNLGDFYDCGCGDEDNKGAAGGAGTDADAAVDAGELKLEKDEVPANR
ncbi:Uu.00g037100.m01.CDS01 [Anthostomella pinea]|uniref:Sulfhydryl oxidase n=1 Tax=Anthostomella pinea TaxID=933095 RepID=A0AAI8VA26_9PEZI|nr:Uu.00g037100.m01.CDS01 [Anthostomella pinea]